MNNIRKLEIEISSFCNRNCAWCSNTIANRSFVENMKEEIFIKIISELERMDFDKSKLSIAFSKFNEPTYDLSLLKLRTYQLKLYLPEVNLYINTNGDYILDNKEMFEYPINRMSIMDYDCKGIDYGIDILNKLGATDIRVGEYIKAKINNIEIRFEPNWPLRHAIEDRGNLIHNLQMKWKNNNELRNRSCYVNKRPLSIDYLGNVTPCCHIRADVECHKPFIIGNVENQTIEEIIYGDKFKEFNAIMEGDNCADYFYPCQYCQK